MNRKKNQIRELSSDSAETNEIYVYKNGTDSDIRMSVRPISIKGDYARDASSGKDNVIPYVSTQDTTAYAVSITAANTDYYTMMNSESTTYTAAKTSATTALSASTPTTVTANSDAKDSY